MSRDARFQRAPWVKADTLPNGEFRVPEVRDIKLFILQYWLSEGKLDLEHTHKSYRRNSLMDCWRDAFREALDLRRSKRYQWIVDMRIVFQAAYSELEAIVDDANALNLAHLKIIESLVVENEQTAAAGT